MTDWTVDDLSKDQALGRAGGTRRPDDLRRLARHPDIKVRAVVAANPAAPIDVLGELIRSTDLAPRRAAIRNPSVGLAEVIDLLGDPIKPHRDVIDVINRRPMTERDLTALARTRSTEFKATAARDSRLPLDEARRLARSNPRDEQITVPLIERGVLPFRAFRHLLRTGEPGVLERLAACETRRWYRARMIVAYPTKRLRPVHRTLGGDPTTPGWAIQVLAATPHWDVRVALIDARRLSRYRLWRASWSGISAVQAAVARSPKSGSWTQLRCARQSPPVRLALAQNPSLSTRVADQLVNGGDEWVRGAAMGNPALPAQRIVELADDSSLLPWQQRMLASNPSCPPEVADQLLTWLALTGTDAGDPAFQPFDGPASWREPKPPSPLTTEHASSAVGVQRARSLANQREAHPGTLKLLRSDPSAEVRRVVANYQHRETLQSLVGDPDPATRTRARHTLETMPAAPKTGTSNRRRRWALVIGAIVLIRLLVALGESSDTDSPTASTQPLPVVGLPSTFATPTVEPGSDPNTAIVTVENAGANVIRVWGASLCETVDADPPHSRFVRLEVRFCDEPGTITIEWHLSGLSLRRQVNPPPDMIEP